MGDILGMDVEFESENEGGLDLSADIVESKVKRMPFMIWNVGGVDYRLKLTASMICKLEDKYKRNLLKMVDDIPPLSVMLTIVQAAMQKYNHGITFSKVQDLYDIYTEDGGNQIDFFTDVVMELFTVSGFFTETQAEKVEEAKKNLE